MNKNIAIKVEDVSKMYRLGRVNTGSFGHDLQRWWAKVRGKEDPFAMVAVENDRTTKTDSNYVWALRNVSFEVEKGEVLGIVGRNGAGKSTLLKILTRVTLPTTGTLKANGRIASLLEVGTGFHPDLTGRENIFLNGAILGMTKKEIKNKFDEIVDFSGVERYIDTPVKRYSSGMYVRLAFGVAAHLESEILILDEVLAVGDMEFQKKCLGKMNDVSKNEGRTVLFVSHNMGAVKTLCDKGIILKNGEMVLSGSANEVIKYYITGGGNSRANYKEDPEIDCEFFKIKSIGIKNANREYEEDIEDNEDIELTMIYDLDAEPERYHITYHMVNETGEPIFSFSSARDGINLKRGEHKLKCIFPKYFLQSGGFSISFYLIEDRRMAVCTEKDLLSFVIMDSRRNLGVYLGREPGFVKPKFNWQLETL
ncbi:MAG: ABC transporter ATP-binding protein [Cytophagales bacterium]